MRKAEEYYSEQQLSSAQQPDVINILNILA
jgi:hypothetical protein